MLVGDPADPGAPAGVEALAQGRGPAVGEALEEIVVAAVEHLQRHHPLARPRVVAELLEPERLAPGMVEPGDPVSPAVDDRRRGGAHQPVEERPHRADVDDVGEVLASPHVDMTQQRLRPLEATDRGEGAVGIGRVGQFPCPRPVRAGDAADLLVRRRQQPRERIAEDVVGDRGMVGERREVQPGAPHRVEGEVRVAVAV
ncbi:hypothetical protein ACIRON_28330 [Nocardioides sp. NPDC101246]|uniref:hypothetical protein n=1 Tax=Nocardioides sp. NPDC101246 TaxID=3364336 RepID=UPI00380DE259